LTIARALYDRALKIRLKEEQFLWEEKADLLAVDFPYLEQLKFDFVCWVLI
jgi:hypothetical protein